MARKQSAPGILQQSNPTPATLVAVEPMPENFK
jgi:hypothetical protein